METLQEMYLHINANLNDLSIGEQFRISGHILIGAMLWIFILKT
jgi:hypothetical protein